MSEKTPDGILRGDWNQLQQLVADYVNDELQSGASNETLIRNSILNLIDELVLKYGEIPSLLATRADYVENNEEAAMILEEAYKLSDATGDYRNKTFIASSLAELYQDEIKDSLKGGRWIEQLSKDLEFYYDEDEHEVLRELRRRLDGDSPRKYTKS